MKYFVKLAGKAFGPLEEEKIVEMYHSGRLKDPVEISRDKTDWNSIGTILPSPPLSELPPAEPPQTEITGFPALEQSVQKAVDTNASVWYYSADGSKGYGPVTKLDLETMLQCGMLNAGSLVWRQGENSRPISVVPELTDILMSFGSSTFSRAGGETGFVPSIPALSDNSSFNGTASFNAPGLGAFSPDSTANSNSTNMFDLLDDPNFGNDGFGYSRDPNFIHTGPVSRMSYVLMAIFFGQLGIHNFYSKRIDIAIVQLFIGLSNLVGLIIISFVSLVTEGEGQFLFIIPALIGFGLELWAIIETCVVTIDGTGRRMY